MTYLQRLVINTLTFMAMAVLLPTHFFLDSWVTALIASFILSLLNMLVRPVLTVLSLPFMLLTFGLFSFVVNGFMLTLTSHLVGASRFGFSSFWWTMVCAAIMSLINMIISKHTFDNQNVN